MRRFLSVVLVLLRLRLCEQPTIEDSYQQNPSEVPAFLVPVETGFCFYMYRVVMEKHSAAAVVIFQACIDGQPPVLP
jgi:hypothetical protein